MAKKGTITLPSAKAPVAKSVAELLKSSATAPTPEDVEKAAAEKRHADAIAEFEASAIVADKGLVAKIEAIGAEGARQYAETRTHDEKMLSLVASVHPDSQWIFWGFYKLVAGYIEAKYGEYARLRYRMALKKQCDTLKVAFPTASEKGANNASKGQSPKRKYAKAARKIDDAMTACDEFFATLVADAPSLKLWTAIMAELTAIKVKMHMDAENEALKKSA